MRQPPREGGEAPGISIGAMRFFAFARRLCRSVGRSGGRAGGVTRFDHSPPPPSLPPLSLSSSRCSSLPLGGVLRANWESMARGLRSTRLALTLSQQPGGVHDLEKGADSLNLRVNLFSQPLLMLQ